MSYIPSWRRWPDQVFTWPAGGAAAWLVLAVDFPEPPSPWWARALVALWVIGLSSLVGAAVAIVLDELRGDMPRRRLRDTRVGRPVWRRLKR